MVWLLCWGLGRLIVHRVAMPPDHVRHVVPRDYAASTWSAEAGGRARLVGTGPNRPWEEADALHHRRRRRPDLLQGLGSGTPRCSATAGRSTPTPGRPRALPRGAGHRAVAHDRRGHGRSSQTWSGNEMDTYADDLACLIDALDLQDLTLVGHSTGGGESSGTSVGTAPPASPGSPWSRRCRRSCCGPRTTPKGCPSRSSTRSAPEAGQPGAAVPRPGRRAFFGNNRDGDVPQGSATPSGSRAWPPGTVAPTSASRPSQPPTSAPTWPSSTSRRWSCTATTTRSCRSTSVAAARPS